ncbi:MAG: rod shape-determining protein MreC [Acidimicrobiales bacterium]
MAVSRRSTRPRFTLLLLILASLTLITIDLRGGGSVPKVRGKARDLFAPVQSAVSSATRPVTDFFNGAFQYRQLKDDNARLRAQLALVRAQQIQDQYLLQTNKDLTDLLKLDFVGDIPTVAARVIAGSESNFQLTIVIDRGSDAGVLKGMPVVAGQGLVGRIISVSARQSTVLLLTDPSASVGIEFAPSNAVGVATGQGSGAALAVTLVVPTAETPLGTVAVTSGLVGSPYPRGVPVGKVASAVPEVGVQSHVVTLSPVVDLSQLSYVDVLIWTSQSAPTPVAPASTGSPTTLPRAGATGGAGGASGTGASGGTSATSAAGQP